MHHHFSCSLEPLQLCPLDIGEIEEMRNLRNRFRHCFVNSSMISPAEQKKWYMHYLKTEDDYVFSIYLQETWIGVASLYYVTAQSAEFGRLMLDSVRAGRHGLGCIAVSATCQIGFFQMGLSEIYLDVYEDNFAAVKTYEKAGFWTTKHTFDTKGKCMFHMVRKKDKGV